MTKANPSIDFRSEQAFIGERFVGSLLKWDLVDNQRKMPWKGEKDPYRIWLSEIILQQTRVEQGLKYYENFIKTFPDVHALARAPEEKVFKLWEGLGYYSRCRNLITTARYISEDLHGRFPETYESIFSLKGVGAYTAAAIASFAYNLPYAVLDGNVFRVLSRIFEWRQPIDSTKGKKQFAAKAQELLPPSRAAAYNQAIMDFGATVCKPVPECGRCFFADTCKAFQSGHQNELPVKEKKVKTRERWFNYVIIECQGEVAIRQRTSKDVWQQLFEFLLIESNGHLTSDILKEEIRKQYGIADFSVINTFMKDQKLSHQTIRFLIVHINVPRKPSLPHFNWVPRLSLPDYAFPKTLQEVVAADLQK